MTDLATDPAGIAPATSEGLLARLRAANVQRVLYPLVQRLNRDAADHGTIRDYTKPPKADLCAQILATWPLDVVLAGIDAVVLAPAASAPVADGAGDAASRALQALREALGPSRTAVDENAVRNIVNEAMATERSAIVEEATAAARSAGIVRHVVQDAKTGETRDVGTQHASFGRLVLIATSRRPNGDRLIPVLIGPPGTGKSFACCALSKALALPYSETGPLQDASDILGYRNVSGDLVRTEFRDRWEHGGVFLFDEYDASDARAAVSVNNGTACGRIAFPDAVVPRHPDCVLVFAGNTDGLGTDAKYTARLRQDASTRSRLVRIRWPIDPALERSLSQGDGAWLAAVLAARAECERRGIRDHVTPRATETGASLLAAGDPIGETIDAVLLFGLRDDAADAVRTVALNAYKAHGGAS